MVLKSLSTPWKKWVKNPFFLRSYIFVFAVIFLAFCSILKANIIYKTDIFQLNFTYGSCVENNQLLSACLFKRFMNFLGLPLNLAPLPQWLSIFILTACVLLLAKIVSRKTWLMPVICALPIALFPSALQPVTYSFDAVIYSLAILGILIPFLYNFPVKFMFLIGFFTGFLFPPVLGAFLFLYCVQEHFNLKLNEKNKDYFLVGFLGSLILWLFYSVNFFIPSDFGNFFTQLPLFFPMPLLFFSLAGLGLTLFILFKYGIFEGIKFILGLIALFTSMLFWNDFNMTRFFSLGLLNATLFLLVWNAFLGKKIVSKFLAVSICFAVWSMVVLGLRYGNLLTVEDDYEMVKIRTAVQEANLFNYKNLMLEGELLAPIIQKKNQTVPLWEKILKNDVNAQYYRKKLSYILGINIKACYPSTAILLSNTPNHQIVGNKNDCLVIQLKNDESK